MCRSLFLGSDYRLANPLFQSFFFCSAEIFARWSMPEKEMPASQSLPFLGHASLYHVSYYRANNKSRKKSRAMVSLSALSEYSKRAFPFLEFLSIALQQILLLSVQLFSFMQHAWQIYTCHTFQVQMWYVTLFWWQRFEPHLFVTSHFIRNLLFART